MSVNPDEAEEANNIIIWSLAEADETIPEYLHGKTYTYVVTIVSLKN